ncbi:MAG TPA: hemerythrin domain-containing protein [Polyangiaceae bacterium]|jgi:hemerythrin superfamily protein
MGTMIKNGTDVVTFLKAQHQDIKRMFQEVLQARGEERVRAFVALRRTLAVHETAEEEIVHPAARRSLPGGDIIVSQRLSEENRAKKLLTEIEKLACDSGEFLTRFEALKSAVLAHAEAEERQEFDKLAALLDPDRLERMRKAAEFAEKVAPTRPHAGVESQAANFLVGPFAAMLDRSRDALAAKRS